MSFSSEMKKDLSKHEQTSKCCTLAEIAGFARVSGSIRLMGGGRINVSLSSEDPSIARHFKLLLQSYFDTTTSLDVIQEKAFRRGNIYRITFDDESTAEQMLRETGLLKVREGSNIITDGIDPGVTRKKCCKKAYLRGLFLASGSVTHPEKAYHTEITCKTEMTAADTRKLLHAFGIDAKITSRRSNYVVYIKESDAIIDFLNVIGAHNQLLEFENIRIVKEMKNRTNRIVNCENANLDKSVNTAGRQIEDIRLIQERKGLQFLPQKLQATAVARLQNPEMSLAELAAAMEPPISKSGANHRLARISEIARKLREES